MKTEKLKNEVSLYLLQKKSSVSGKKEQALKPALFNYTYLYNKFDKDALRYYTNFQLKKN